MSDRLTRLAHAARAGDQPALESLVAASYEDVWRLCAALVDRQAADDLAQETFVRVTTSLRRFRGDSGARTWVFSIARRVCIDEIRLRGRMRRRDATLAAGQDATSPQGAGDAFEVRDLLAQLEPDRRTAFVLTQLFRLSYEEAAHVCACPTGTIRSRVARAREDLVRLTGDTNEDVHRLPQG